MKTIILGNDAAVDALEVLGGAEYYQNARREYLEIIVAKEGNTVEALEAVLSPENCAAMTIAETVEGEEETEQYVHEGYVIRGTVKVYRDERDDTWKISVRRYQQTEMERTVASLQAAVAALQAGA